MSDFGRRYYSATLGRWLNRDPLGDLGGANVYAYVGNNPTNRTDCLGLMLAECRPGEPCHNQLYSGGGEPPDEGDTKKDKKPCPGKADLYQQSKPTTQPRANRPCDAVDWSGGGQSATTCDGNGNVIVCLNPGSFPGADPGGGCSSGSANPIEACVCRGEKKAQEKLSSKPDACKDKDGNNLPAGTLNPDEPGKPFARGETELLVHDEIIKCLGEKYDEICGTADKLRKNWEVCATIRSWKKDAQKARDEIWRQMNTYDVPLPPHLRRAR